MNAILMHSLGPLQSFFFVAISFNIVLLAPSIAAVIDEDGRMTEAQYAKKKRVPLAAVQNRFSATGVLICSGWRGSAQLTGAPNIITTSAHMFRDNDSCNVVTTPDSCEFSIKVGTTESRYKVQSLVGTGSPCPFHPPFIAEDWAILKLKKSVEGVTPYALPNDGNFGENSRSILAISARQKDFMRPSNSAGERFPKSIEECESKGAIREAGKPLHFQSNCDFSPGGSGGSILVSDGGTDTLIGIHVSNDETKESLDAALAKKSVNRGAFISNEWASYYAPLTGAFLDALRKAVSDSVNKPASGMRR